MTPERRIADRIVIDFDLVPPVDIESLASNFAELRFEDWPQDCDGLTVGLGGDLPPKIFVKVSTHELGRRFTIAHELGHVLIPWHTGTIACVPGDGTSAFGTGSMTEREASSFASRILVPTRFLREITEDPVTFTETFRSLELAKVSVPAGLIALANALPAGHVLTIVESRRSFYSPGTRAPSALYPKTWDERLRDWREAAAESGTASYWNKDILWFRFERIQHPIPDGDPRDTTQILRDAISSLTDDAMERTSILNTINGIVGYALSMPEARASPARALAVLRHRVRDRPALEGLLGSSDFDLFLARRASSISSPGNDNG